MGWPGALVGLGVVALQQVVQMVFNILRTAMAVPMCTGMAGLCLDGKKWNAAHGFSGSLQMSLF